MHAAHHNNMQKRYTSVARGKVDTYAYIDCVFGFQQQRTGTVAFVHGPLSRTHTGFRQRFAAEYTRTVTDEVYTRHTQRDTHNDSQAQCKRQIHFHTRE